jgi:chromosome segregation and condensation protein ScpB
MISAVIYATIEPVNEKNLYRLCDCSAAPGQELQAEMFMTPELANRLNAIVRAKDDYTRWFRAD